MKRSTRAVLFFPILLTGCAQVHLDKLPIVQVQANLSSGPGIAPGEKSQLVLAFKQPNGAMFASEGKGGGHVSWKDVAVRASVVKVDTKGVVSLPADPRISDGKVPHVTITLPSHPGVQTNLDIPVRYDRAFHANFSGAPGAPGLDGANGTDGSAGMDGSSDPDHPSAGARGTDGGSGGDGGKGGNGGNGPPLDVRMTLRQGTHPLLQVSVATRVLLGRSKKLFLIDPRGGSLTVTSAGGAGGPGGKGGRGGRGGAGGSGFPPGSSGNDGADGHPGSDGSSGSTGVITVMYDPSAKPYLAALRVGDQGSHPVFKEMPVPSLW